MRFKRKIMNIVNTNDRHKVLGLLLICLFSIVVVLINRKIDAPAEETFMALWDEYKDSDQFTDVKRQLIKELNGHFQCPGCPPVNCPICEECIQCETCATQATVTCPECETCSQLESAEKTVAELAAKYLVIDFEPFENNAHLEKFDFVPQQTVQYKCESNPELDKYVRKPQFSRDQLDYDVQRSGYVPRRLVCDELATHEAHVQSKHWLDKCDNVEPLNSVITVIGSNLTQVAIDRINELELRIVPTIEQVKSPYSLVLTQHFDFDALDANLWRMVREAENQNADLVFGSWRNEQGQWSSSCLHYNVQNYTLHVWDGYYKSISSMKYCDMAIGPVLVRSEHFDTKLISLAVADRIDYHLRRPDLRVITCLDCMFYQGDVGDISKETMQPLAFIYTLNQIDYVGAKFEYTCPEAGIECNVKYYDQAGLAQPPCCLRILTGMTMALTAEYEQNNESLCVYCGQVLAALKMPGGQLPWDTDVDMPMMAANFEFNVDNIVTSSALAKYGLSTNINRGRHQPNELGEVEGGMVVVKHDASRYTLDHYAKAPSKLQCGHQVADHGRPGTTMLLDGVWVPAPDNPGAYGRTYGDEIYRHVLHVKSSTNTYNEQEAEFRLCDKPPYHACLGDYPADGNIQFRGDLHGLRPLN